MRLSHLHFYHRHQVHRLHFTNFWIYELAAWCQAFALSLVSIFIPILMLQAGYSIPAIIAYLLLFNIFDVPLNFVARALVRRVGARLVLVLATLAVIGFFLIFRHIEGGGWNILVALALAAALYDALYWVAHVYLFIESDRAVTHAGENTGILYSLRQMAALAGPALGAALLIFFDQSVLLWATIGGLLVSLLPLLALSHMPDRPRAMASAIKIFKGASKRPFLLLFCYAIAESVDSSIFPLFIFLTFGTLASVAAVPVLVSVAAIILVLVVGHAKHDFRSFAMVAAALAIALVWFGRLQFETTLFLYASVLAVGFLKGAIIVPVDADIFEHGRRVGDPLSVATYRNAIYMAANIVLYGSLLLWVNIFEPSFVFAAVSMLALVAVQVVFAFGKRRA